MADLGLSKLLENVSDEHASVASQSTLGDLERNPLWTAPEIACHGKDATCSSDVWSFGVIMWELLTGKMPWSHLNCPRNVFGFVVRWSR